jgi:hypothetical protein
LQEGSTRSNLSHDSDTSLPVDQPAHAKEQKIVGTTSTVIRVPIIDHSKDPDYSKTNWSLEDAKVDMEIMKQNGIADAIRVPQSYYVRFLF